MSATAAENFASHVKANVYPGRGIIVGKNTAGQWIQVYWIMGRSENSRNRVFVVDAATNTVKTQAADPSKVKDPSLIIYNALRNSGDRFIVTNGDQTDTIFEGLEKGLTFEDSLMSRTHEPDAPNFTPRISAVIDVSADAKAAVAISMVRKSPFSDTESEYRSFRYNTIANGFGYGITTYKHDAAVLPSFDGAPILLPLEGSAEEIAQTYFAALNEDNKISLVVRVIDTATPANNTFVVLNKFASV
eukprot:TRINITY_DN297_c0_g3_i1.p2 TRINITY_DN297_c0_g3~~TRINITY_DN297_c0_g3_i1.p2  ORF type:complete len:246 (-),score=66.27 TRINITY_DN297_c0_g3_i1:250-987(-)